MTETAEIARRFIQAWNAGSETVVDELAASDLVVAYSHFPEPLHGPEAFKDMLRMTHEHFPDLAVSVEAVMADPAGCAAIEWRYRGTFRSGELFGVRASDQPVEVAGMTRFDIDDGLVRTERGVVDNLALAMQLGASP